MFEKNNKYVMPEMIYQDEVNECGLACIAMLASMLGRNYSLDELRSQFKISNAGMSLEQITLALECLNIRAYPVSYDPKEMLDLPFPAILHHGGNHFVLVSDKKGRYARVHNPATGEGVFLDSDLQDRLTGYAVILDSHQNPVDNEIIPITNRDSYKKNFSISKMNIPNMSKMFYFSVLLMLGGLLIPALFLLLLGDNDRYNDLVDGGAYTQLLVPVVSVIFITALLELFVARLSIKSSSSVSLRYIPEFFSSLLKKKYSFFENRALADINQRFSSLSQAIAERANLLITMRVSIITCVGAVIVMFWVHPLLGALSIFVITCYGVISIYYSQPRTMLIRRLEESSSLRNEIVFESINGISTIKSAHMHHERCEKFSMHHMDVIEISRQLAMMDAKQTVLYKVFSNFESLLLLVISIILIVKNELSVGGLFAFTLFKQIASSAATSFYMSAISYKEQMVVDSRAQPIVSYPEDNLDLYSEGAMNSIEIVGVVFSYNRDSILYDQLDFSIVKGEKIAIIGSSGCGKSSLLKLLSGLHCPTKGRLLINGCDKEWHVLNALSFYLQQHDIIFTGSVMDNVVLFKRDADIDRAMDVISSLGLDDCIDMLPHRWKTTISENNPLMSSGQRQRLLVARALCTEKPLVMLDEPTANLDSKSAKQVIKSILSSDKTVLVVLHDPELLDGFDRVIRVEQGLLFSEAMP